MNDQLQLHVDDLCQRARPAAATLAALSDAERVAALESCAQALQAASADILKANALDLSAAAANDLPAAMVDRLRLDEQRLAGIINDVRAVAGQSDPVGRILEQRTLAQGMTLSRVSVPLGVIAVIFESRPNVTVDTAALCLRSGNACILRGGSEAVHSNRALAAALQTGLAHSAVPSDAVQLVMQQDRSLITALLARDDAIDLVIPRGGEGLIKAVCQVSRIPVVKHDKGVCSLYVHSAAEVAMAVELVVNAKCQRPGVCNAIENLLIDTAVVDSHLPVIAEALLAAGVELRGDEATCRVVPQAKPVNPSDYHEEYLGLILAIKVVADLEEAIAFTAEYSSHHSDGIITADQEAAQRYVRLVDSAVVYHNASTRFTDGGQFGLGAEVGISTNRLHARGPMGINELCTYKYIVYGTGHIRP